MPLTALSSDSSPFTTPEDVLSERLGVPRKDLRRLRLTKLQTGLHWQLVGQHVHYSEAGIELLLDLTQLRSQPGEPPVTAADVPEKAQIIRLNPNPRIVTCSLNGRLVDVEVALGLPVVPGMIIPVVRRADTGGYRCPRWT
jgi:hypothetical protein